MQKIKIDYGKEVVEEQFDRNITILERDIDGKAQVKFFADNIQFEDSFRMINHLIGVLFWQLYDEDRQIAKIFLQNIIKLLNQLYVIAFTDTASKGN